MGSLLAQVSSFSHDVAPWLVALLGICATLFLHQKNRRLERAHNDLARKLDGVSNTKLEEDIAETVKRVSAHDKHRLELEKEFDSSFDSDDPKPKPGD